MDLNGQDRYTVAVGFLMLMLLYDIIQALVYLVKLYISRRENSSEKKCRMWDRERENRAMRKKRIPLLILKLQRFSDPERENNYVCENILEHLQHTAKQGTDNLECTGPMSSLRQYSTLSRQWKESVYDTRKSQGIRQERMKLQRSYTQTTVSRCNINH